MRLTYSARKHFIDQDICEQDVLDAWANQIVHHEQEYEPGSVQVLALGRDSRGRLLEVVACDSPRPTRIRHAMLMRAKFARLLPRSERP